MKPKDKNYSGSILLEVLLTVMVISIGLTFVVGAYLSGYRAMRMISEQSRAILWIDDKMTELTYQGIVPDASMGTLDPTASSLPEKFEVTQDLGLASGLSAVDLSQLTLRLSWKTSGKPSILSISTYLFNPSYDQ